jgi:hypothetical protein
VFGVALALQPDFTQLGHLTALLIGLASYPLTRSRQLDHTADSVPAPAAQRSDVVGVSRWQPVRLRRWRLAKAAGAAPQLNSKI